MGFGVPSSPSSALEDLREQRTGDSLFFRRIPPIFELQVPSRVTRNSGTSFLFPLPMPPRAIDIEYPFAVEVTPTGAGGNVVEENGVVTVMIRISGTMGQRPKPFKGSFFGRIAPPDRRMSARSVVSKTVQGQSISGHRYLLHLRDAVFGLYSDLKQDPEFAEETRMILHIPKDDEHYIVVPHMFRVPRDVARARLTWDYEITLEGTEIAKAPLVTAPEDRSILQKLLDGVAAVRSAIRLGQAAVRDLSLIRSEIENVARQVTGAIDDAASVLEEAQNFIDGTKQALSIGRARVESSVERLETAVEVLASNVSDDTAHLTLEISDSMHELLAHPDMFTPPPDVVVEAAFRRGLGVLADRDRAALESSSEDAPPANERALRAGGDLPGDFVRDDRARALPEELRQYRSAYEAEVSDGDTLELLAARHLGDARRWRHIAILNSLQDPYISNASLPNTLASGMRILIPSTGSPAQRSENPAVFGSRPEDSPEIRELGVDWLVTRDPVSGLEDWVPDTGNGSTDLQTASGLACLTQDLQLILETERNSDPLYKNFGIAPAIGFGVPEIEIDAQRLRVVEALETDPRVVRASDVEITPKSGDTLDTVVRVEVRGLRTPVQVSTPSLASP